MASVKDFINSNLGYINEASKVLDKIMSKVSQGEELTDKEKDNLGAAIDVAKGDSSGSIDKIMKKVRDGEELSNSDQKKLSAAIDASIEEGFEIQGMNEMVGDSDLKKMADEASNLAKSCPKGVTLVNRLAKTKNPAASTVRRKIDQAQKLVEELKEAKSKIAPLKDTDVSGRKALKQKLQKIVTGLRKYQGLEKEAERVLAEINSKGDVAAVKQKWDKKKTDFKEKVKENIKGKKAERTEKVKSMVGKAKAKARHSIAKFSN